MAHDESEQDPYSPERLLFCVTMRCDMKVTIHANKSPAMCARLCEKKCTLKCDSIE